MFKSKTKKLIFIGVLCVLFLLGAVWYSNTFNEARLVAPMDYSSYEYHPKDTPMIASLLFLILYVLYLIVSILKKVFHNRTHQNSAYTRALSPKLGFLGFFGLLGFAGFITYSIDKTIFPFIFFSFFGFFGFFFEGKMSHTFMDERFRANAEKAQLISLKIGFSLLFLILLLIGLGFFGSNLEFYAIILVVSISMIYGVTMFLSEYLLYRYDHDDEFDEV